MMEYREVLAHYLKQLGINQSELSRRLGKSRSSIGNITAGRTKEPSLHKAYEIAKALGVSIDEMCAMMFDESNDDCEG